MGVLRSFRRRHDRCHLGHARLLPRGVFRGTEGASTMRGLRALAAVLVSAPLFFAPAEARAHLFHKLWEPPETQLTRDTRVLLLLLDDPAERFDLARQVYEGHTRVRLKPGGFRRWLIRPNEPGMVFKADYQLHRWSGSLEAEAGRIDRERGTRLGPRLDAALTDGDRGGVRAALREVDGVLRGEPLGAEGAR